MRGFECERAQREGFGKDLGVGVGEGVAVEDAAAVEVRVLDEAHVRARADRLEHPAHRLRPERILEKLEVLEPRRVGDAGGECFCRGLVDDVLRGEEGFEVG